MLKIVSKIKHANSKLFYSNYSKLFPIKTKKIKAIVLLCYIYYSWILWFVQYPHRINILPILKDSQ